MAKIREHCNTWVQMALHEPGQPLQHSLFDPDPDPDSDPDFDFDSDPDFDLLRIRY
jgi:hypothetical protein